MKYVVDTNIVSEFMKPSPNDNVIGWAQDHNKDILLSSITVQELYYGLFTMPNGKRKEILRESIDAIIRECKDRILPFDAFCSYLCAELRANTRRMGRPGTIEDLMIAAICKRNDAILVTHNTKDFDYLGIQLCDPFEYESETLKHLKRKEQDNSPQEQFDEQINVAFEGRNQ